MSAVTEKKILTPNDQNVIERETGIRHELHFGQVFPIEATTDSHNDIVFKARIALAKAFEDRPCKVYSEGVKLELIKDQYRIYPDLMVTYDDKDHDDPYIKRNPSLVGEVLSKSTEVNDRGQKFIHCLQLSSLKYYLLISQYEYRVEVFTKREKGWLYERFESLDDHVLLDLIDIQLSLKDIYDGVTLQTLGKA